jgi:UDP-glucose 4-epimerase
MRVLVTGGAGFIGSNLCAALLRAGHEVGVVDDLSTGRPENVDSRAWFRRLDILDLALESVVAEFEAESIVHLAAQPSVAASIRDRERDWAVNAEGTAAVARAADAAGVRRMISASSAAVYGEPASVPLVESSPKSPENPYGCSKLAAEGMLADTLRDSDTDFASFRFSNVYGPRQDAVGEGGVVALFCHALVSGSSPQIFGSGEQTRDFIFVGDLVAAIIAALHTDVVLASAPAADSVVDAAAYNISTGGETSVNVLAASLTEVSGICAEFARRPARDGDVERSALDPSKVADVLQWRALTPLRDGLAETWAWFSAAKSDSRA